MLHTHSANGNLVKNYTINAQQNTNPLSQHPLDSSPAPPPHLKLVLVLRESRSLHLSSPQAVSDRRVLLCQHRHLVMKPRLYLAGLALKQPYLEELVEFGALGAPQVLQSVPRDLELRAQLFQICETSCVCVCVCVCARV